MPFFRKIGYKADGARKKSIILEEYIPYASERIVPIYKSDLDQKLLPVLIQGYQSREGYRFFTLDDTGRIHEFYWRGLKDRDAYFDLIRKIALFIIEKTGITPAKPVAAFQPPEITGPRKTVFVAVAAADLKDARQRLVNDLKASGTHVVPEDNALPETSEALEQVLNQALSEAEYAIHLIGESRGFTAEGATDPIVDQQLKLARKSGVSRILWVPRWLPNQKDKPRDPFEVLQQRFAGLQPQEEIHHGEVTDLSQWLRQRLQSATPATNALDIPVSYHRILVASAHADDEELAADLANQMQACGFTVKLYFSDDDAMPAQDLMDTLVWIPWGNAGVTDLESMLDKLATAGKIVCLRLPGGDEKAKRRFLKEKILVKKIDQLPADRSAIQALLDSLNITVQSAPTGEKA